MRWLANFYNFSFQKNSYFPRAGGNFTSKRRRYVDDMLNLANDINKINKLQHTFPKNSVLNFTHELNKNNKISFLDVLINANNNNNNNNNNFTTSTYKNPLIITPAPSTLKVNAPSNIKKQLSTWCRFSRYYILGIYNLNLIEFILKPVLISLNVFSSWHYL